MAELAVELEADFVCPKCHGIPYRLFRRQAYPGSDHFVNVLRAGPDGNADVPDDRKNLRCPNCNVPVERR